MRKHRPKQTRPAQGPVVQIPTTLLAELRAVKARTGAPHRETMRRIAQAALTPVGRKLWED